MQLRRRRGVVTAAVTATAAVSGVVALPIVPARVLHDTPPVAMNYDAGEQVGWPAFCADRHAGLRRAA